MSFPALRLTTAPIACTSASVRACFGSIGLNLGMCSYPLIFFDKFVNSVLFDENFVTADNTVSPRLEYLFFDVFKVRQLIPTVMLGLTGREFCHDL